MITNEYIEETYDNYYDYVEEVMQAMAECSPCFNGIQYPSFNEFCDIYEQVGSPIDPGYEYARLYAKEFTDKKGKPIRNIRRYIEKQMEWLNW